MPTVRYFAAAAEAAGCEEERLDLAGGDVVTVADVRAAIAAVHGHSLALVLARCSVLVDGVRSEDDAVVAPDAVVDVLPPFAGG